MKPNGQKSSSTSSWILELLYGDPAAFDSFLPQYYIGVRDTAKLHVIALMDPACNGERIFALAEPFNRTNVLAAFPQLFPGKTFPADQEVGRDLSIISTHEAEALPLKHYRKPFTSLKECLAALTAGLDDDRCLGFAL